MSVSVAFKILDGEDRPKLAILAAGLGVTDFDALGRLVFLWMDRTRRRSEIMEEKYIRARLGPRGVEALLEADLCERAGDGIRLRGDGRTKWYGGRIEAARQGGLVSAQARSKPRVGDGTDASDAGDGTGNEAPKAASDGADVEANAKQIPSKREANAKQKGSTSKDLISDLRSETLSSEASASSETSRDLQQGAPVSGRRKSPSRPMPADFAPTEGHRAFAREHCLDLDAEFLRFADHHRARGNVFADWPAALRTWLRNEVKFRAERQARAGGRPIGVAPQVRSDGYKAGMLPLVRTGGGR